MKAKLAFFEIPAQDFTRAVNFYRSALDFEIDECEYGNEMMGMISTEGSAGSIFKSNGFLPSSDGVIISFEVENIERTLQNAERFGGKAIRPKTKIEAENMGYFALFSDSEGNTIGLYSVN